MLHLGIKWCNTWAIHDASHRLVKHTPFSVLHTLQFLFSPNLFIFELSNLTLLLRPKLLIYHHAYLAQSFIQIFVIGLVTDILFRLSCPRRQAQLCNLNLIYNGFYRLCQVQPLALTNIQWLLKEGMSDLHNAAL